MCKGSRGEVCAARAILLVDDSPFDVELTLHDLRRQPLANPIVVLRDGAEALDYLFCRGAFFDRSCNDLPCLLLLDLRLPKLDGLEVLAALRTDPRTRWLPVVVLTSSAADPDLQRCRALGVTRYIVKPVDFTQLVDAVAALDCGWTLLPAGLPASPTEPHRRASRRHTAQWPLHGL